MLLSLLLRLLRLLLLLRLLRLLRLRLRLGWLKSHRLLHYPCNLEHWHVCLDSWWRLQGLHAQLLYLKPKMSGRVVLVVLVVEEEEKKKD
jgi:hypothetical protein